MGKNCGNCEWQKPTFDEKEQVSGHLCHYAARNDHSEDAGVYIESLEICCDKHTYRKDEALIIVKQLAKLDHLDSEGDCVFCGAWLSVGHDHEPGCVWLRAKGLVDNSKEAKGEG